MDFGPSDKSELIGRYLGDGTFLNMSNDQSQKYETITKDKTDDLPNNEDQNTNDLPQQDEGVLRIFEGHTFTIFGFSVKETKQLYEMIESVGGSMATGDKTEYAVCGIYINDYDFVPDHVELDNVQYCIEQEKVVHVDSCVLFRPIWPICSAVRPLVGCVVMFTGFSGVLCDALTHVTEAMGASVTQTLGGVNKGGILVTTHLIANEPTGKKYKSAMKLNINVVAVDWVYAAVETNERPDESKFPVVVSITAMDPIPTFNI